MSSPTPPEQPFHAHLTEEQRARRDAERARRAAREAALAAEDAKRPPDGFPPLPIRHAPRNRELARRRCIRLAGEAILKGRAISDIAAEEGISPGRLRDIFEAHGIPPIHRRGARLLSLLAIGSGPSRGLESVAAELSMRPEELAELFLVICFRRYGRVAKQILARRLEQARPAN